MLIPLPAGSAKRTLNVHDTGRGGEEGGERREEGKRWMEEGGRGEGERRSEEGEERWVVGGG